MPAAEGRSRAHVIRLALISSLQNAQSNAGSAHSLDQGTHMTRLIARNILLLAVLLCASAARAEVNEIRLARQYGIAFLPFIVMEQHKLIEKHAKEQALGDVKVSWGQFAGSAGMNDALLSDNLSFGAGAVPSLILLWARTKGSPQEVRGVSATNSMPVYLNTRNPSINSLKDFTDKDKIALPSVKLSTAAIVLQMAAAKTFGDANYAKLDPLTVSMSHPDAVAAILSDASEVNSHFASPPYQIIELKNPRIRNVLSSYDVMGDASLTAVWTTKKFADANPKTVAAVFAAVKDAVDTINRDKKAAAELYLSVTKEKTPLADMMQLLNDPRTIFTNVPQASLRFAEFMHKIGTIKEAPTSWRDMFLPIAHRLPGS